ncbi:MAG: VWA domain-containing protein [Pyrinomonadaceae bacterium]|nr:VWA domain-containing protein [Pyrinomonadaceae bacterium]
MNKLLTRSLAAIMLFSTISTTLAQQQPQRTNPPQQKQDATSDDDVVRISTNLVQVDAVVTDKKGRLITDLRPEEMEIYEDNREQKITNFSFISTESATGESGALKPLPPINKNSPPVPPVRLKPEQVRRTIALIIDDLSLSFESTHFVRRALKKFVDEQMQPGDLVAIIRTAGGMGALQQFTSDRRQLYAAIDRVRFSFRGNGLIGAFAPLQGRAPSATDGTPFGGPGGAGIINGTDVDDLREEMYTVGTLGAVNYVVRGMRELPGRKSVLLIADGIPVQSSVNEARTDRIGNAMRRLIDMANRASVVIYTMDARGLPTFGLNAADDTSGIRPDELEGLLRGRRNAFFDSLVGMSLLAKQTGGFSIALNNDLTDGIKQVLNDQKGYYLIGYRPDESTFDPVTGRRKFHDIKIKVKRPGLQVRSRSGFYGISNEKAAPQPKTRPEQLLSAITSPFASGGVQLRLTSLFGNDPKAGSYMRSLLHVAAKDITFTEEADGWHKAVFDVAAITFGDNGTVVDQVDRIQTIRVRGDAYKRALENGFVFIITVPVKKPGAYQLRTALRDTASERVGSASQFIEVPDIKKNRLAISGIAVRGVDPRAKANATDKGSTGITLAPGVQSERGEEEITDTNPQAGPAVRKFRRGMILEYGYVIYNAQVNKAGQTLLQTQMKLFRDGKEIFTGQMQPLTTSNQPDMKRLPMAGGLQLSSDMEPGEYVLQIIVIDSLGKTKYQLATQWIDFEIVK